MAANRIEPEECARCNGSGIYTHRGPAPRVDTVRNSLEATEQLLVMVRAELHDLHTLAYDRATAAEEAKVRGGQRDYALDTHGDKRARNAYRALAFAGYDASRDIATACHDVLALLREGDDEGTRRRGARTIRAEELASQISAQARRIGRGEYTPVRHLPQPEVNDAMRNVYRLAEQHNTAIREIRDLRRENKHLREELANARQGRRDRRP